jgi:hypothetical protein
MIAKSLDFRADAKIYAIGMPIAINIGNQPVEPGSSC